MNVSGGESLITNQQAVSLKISVVRQEQELQRPPLREIQQLPSALVSMSSPAVRKIGKTCFLLESAPNTSDKAFLAT